MRKYIFAALLVSLSLIVFAQAEPAIKSLHAVGKGIAISASDPGDFKLLKIGIAKVSVSVLGEEQDVSVGILILDEQRYKLKNINVGNGSVTADVFDGNTSVGSLSIVSAQKGDTTVWFGTLSLGDKIYNVYILEVKRDVKAKELGANVADFCRAHPRHESCRERMHEFCEQNPDDARCKQIFLEFCKENPSDVRCRDAVKKFCEGRPDDSLCRKILGERSEKFCEKASDLAEKQCERTAKACKRACKGDDECEEKCEEAEDECEDAAGQREKACLEVGAATTTVTTTSTTLAETATTSTTITTTTLAG